MSRRYVCDKCGVHEPMDGKGVHRPLHWASLRINIRQRRISNDIPQLELCSECTAALLQFMRVEMTA